MKVTLDTAKVTVPVGSFFGDIARGIREANLNRKARKVNKMLDQTVAILARADELRASKSASPSKTGKRVMRTVAKRVAAKKRAR